MITYYCKLCGNAVELGNSNQETPWCANPKCNNGMATMMDIARGDEVGRFFKEEQLNKRKKR